MTGSDEVYVCVLDRPRMHYFVHLCAARGLLRLAFTCMFTRTWHLQIFVVLHVVLHLVVPPQKKPFHLLHFCLQFSVIIAATSVTVLKNYYFFISLLQNISPVGRILTNGALKPRAGKKKKRKERKLNEMISHWK